MGGSSTCVHSGLEEEMKVSLQKILSGLVYMDVVDITT